jgi:hypothetical protein
MAAAPAELHGARHRAGAGLSPHVGAPHDHAAAKLADAMATGEPGNVVAVITDELICEDVQSPDDVPKLNTLELYRLAFVPDLPADVRAARATAWAAISRQPDTGRVYSDGGQSWRAGVDRAMADDSGTDGDNEW